MEQREGLTTTSSPESKKNFTKLKNTTRNQAENSKASLPSQVALVAANPGDIRDAVQSLGPEDHLGEEMATHSSILAWRIPRTENLAGHSPWGLKGSYVTEQLSTHAIFEEN